MLAKQKAFSLLGDEALPVEVEVEVSPSGLPKQVLVGLPETAVEESTHRVERSMVKSGFQRPQSRIAINLAPARRPAVMVPKIFPASHSALRYQWLWPLRLLM